MSTVPPLVYVKKSIRPYVIDEACFIAGYGFDDNLEEITDWTVEIIFYLCLGPILPPSVPSRQVLLQQKPLVPELTVLLVQGPQFQVGPAAFGHIGVQMVHKSA